ncbi:carbohydrate kinase family protein [Candidatus Bathyarchaeota archaeon]|nr:carbohydrate kinase family protein [Candidatus Bathyarchaeota archaeon]
MKLDCVGFGALNTDRLYRVERIAKSGEESFILGCEEHLGGSAANTIVGLSRLEHKVGYIGKVANDDDGRFHLSAFSNEGVDTAGICRVEFGRSGVVMGFVDCRGERALYVDPGVNDTLGIEEINLDYAADSKFLHITSFVGERPFITQIRLLEERPSIQVSFDPGELYVRRGLHALKPFLRRSYVAFPNENELHLLTNEGPEDGAKVLLKEGVEIVAVKLGERGCFVTNGKESFHLPVFKTQIVDTTGAGDAFSAGFLHGLIIGKDINECATLGNLAASRKLSKPGARAGLPRLEDMKI